MIYFKYKSSFKQVNHLASLLQKQEIDYIINEEDFKKHLKKYDDLYCFIDPYKEEINGERALNWGLSEESAYQQYYSSCEEI